MSVTYFVVAFASTWCGVQVGDLSSHHSLSEGNSDAVHYDKANEDTQFAEKNAAAPPF
jgi:hypothetical protein